MELKHQVMWCGGINADQDVSVHLVPNRINQQQVTSLGNQEPLAIMKVHSTRLKRHSKYFQACLSRRWTHQDEAPSTELNLELIYGLQVASYTDCFSRMYVPLCKNFKDVKSSLELLQVASQIEFLELVNPICRYLSTILWSEEDELRIREFSSSPNFPHSQAEDLVARLQIGQHGNEEYRRRLLRDQITHRICIALSPVIQNKKIPPQSIRSARSFFEGLFSSIQRSRIHSAFENDVVLIVSKEVKEMTEHLHADCHKHVSLLLSKDWADIHSERAFGFKGKLEALCWALKLLLRTQVAEEVIECLVQLELLIPMILSAQGIDSRKPASERVSIRFVKLVIFIFREVVAGRVLLSIPDRVLLLENWTYLYYYHELDMQDDILVTWGFRQAAQDLFLTLPLEQQMEAINRSKFTFHPDRITFHEFICTSSLITLMKKNWPADEDALLQADMEADGWRAEEDALLQVDMEADGGAAEVQYN